jgi:hypothetical protein
MSTLQQIVYTLGSDITINMAGLPSGSKALSDAINNSGSQYQQADFGFKFKTNIHGIDKGGTVSVGLLRSCDGGVTYDSNLRAGNILVTIDELDANTEYVLSVSSNTIGFLPAYFKFSIRNDTGAPFFHEASHFGAWWTAKNVVDVASSASLGLSLEGNWLR